jgi:hypothetical protein
MARTFERATSSIYIHLNVFSELVCILPTSVTSVPFDPNVVTKKQDKNYATGKTKKVAWFVSNCGARNGHRQYADVLGKHIQVDI